MQQKRWKIGDQVKAYVPTARFTKEQLEAGDHNHLYLVTVREVAVDGTAQVEVTHHGPVDGLLLPFLPKHAVVTDSLYGEDRP